MLLCDVLVIGAGPAGSTAAKFAAKAGAKVILLEKRKHVGRPVQCAEYVPWQITQEVELPTNVLAQRIDAMRTHLPAGEAVETSAKGFIIYRDLFDQALAKAAVDSGAELFLQTRAVGYEEGLVRASQGGQQIQIKARVMVGADGPHSVVGKWMGSPVQKLVHTAQYQMPLCKGLSSTEIYFRRDIPVGYGWVFPKGKAANVGVGVDLQFKVKPSAALRNFVDYLQQEGVVRGEVMNTTGGVIPAGGLVKRLQRGNMILVGDAAGMAHPITGAGVSNAVLGGKIAGEIAGRAALEDDLSILTEYEEECRILLNDPLTRARQKREALESCWKGNNEGLAKALRLSWIAFEEYFKQP
ncbi:MAG: geranylgeranyl reductase family protein [bacterium]